MGHFGTSDKFRKCHKSKLSVAFMRQHGQQPTTTTTTVTIAGWENNRFSLNRMACVSVSASAINQTKESAYNGQQAKRYREIKRNYDSVVFIDRILTTESPSPGLVGIESVISCNGWVTEANDVRAFNSFASTCYFKTNAKEHDNDDDKNYVKIIEAKRYSFVSVFRLLWVSCHVWFLWYFVLLPSTNYVFFSIPLFKYHVEFLFCCVSSSFFASLIYFTFFVFARFSATQDNHSIAVIILKWFVHSFFTSLLIWLRVGSQWDERKKHTQNDTND